jgi:hypothetical protein
VSGRHCRVFYKEGDGIGEPASLFLEDLSSNGTFRNDKVVDKAVATKLRQGDYIACVISLDGRYQKLKDAFLVDLVGGGLPAKGETDPLGLDVPESTVEPFSFEQLKQEAMAALEAGEVDAEDDAELAVNKVPKTSRAIAWLRGDLRFADNPIISHCPRLGEKDPRGLPVFVFDPRLHSPDVATLDYPTLSDNGGTTGTGSRKMGIRKARFLIESVLELRERLLDNESDLLVLIGKPEELIPKVVYEYEASVVHVTRNDAPFESQVDTEVGRQLQYLYGTKVELRRHWGTQSLHHLDDFQESIARAIPGAYVKYQHVLDNADIQVRPTLDETSLIVSHNCAAQ